MIESKSESFSSDLISYVHLVFPKVQLIFLDLLQCRLPILLQGVEMWFTTKKNPIEEELVRYLEATTKCKGAFVGGVKHFIEHSKVDEGYLKFLHDTQKYEGISDDIRDSIERKMYEDSLIPESRGDVLAFLETFDRIPNTMEGVIEFIDEVALDVPHDLGAEDYESFTKNFIKLCDGIEETFELVRESAECFFTKPRRVRDFTIAIDRHESECDRIESYLKRFVFHNHGFTDLQKVLFKELIKRIGDIADLAEDFQRRIILLSLKNIY